MAKQGKSAPGRGFGFGKRSPGQHDQAGNRPQAAFHSRRLSGNQRWVLQKSTPANVGDGELRAKVSFDVGRSEQPGGKFKKFRTAPGNGFQIRERLKQCCPARFEFGQVGT